MKREELAWAAGFFDGEGHVRYQKTKGKVPYVSVQIRQIDPFVLERFRSAVNNLGKIYGPYPSKGKPYYSYQTQTFESVQAVMGLLFNWLSPIKRRQYMEALQKYTHG